MADVWQSTEEHLSGAPQGGAWQSTQEHLASSHNQAILTRMQNEQQNPEGAVTRFAKGAWDAIRGIGEAVSPVHVGDIQKAQQALQDGDYITALHHAARIGAGPAAMMEDAIRSHIDQAQKAIEMFKAGRTSEGVGHAVAAAVPLVGPQAANLADQATGEPAFADPRQQVEAPRPPDLAGALGQTAVGAALAAGPKAIQVAQRPGMGKIAAGTATLAGSGVVAVAGHPYAGVGGAIEGANLIRQGVQQMRSATVPPAVEPSTGPPQVAAQPPAAGPPQLPPPVLPDAARFGAPVRPPLAQAVPSLPVQAAPVQVAAEPVAPFNPDSLPPDPYKSGSGYERGLINMLERKSRLSGAQQQMLADLKAREAARSQVPSGEAPTQGPPSSSDPTLDQAAPQGAPQVQTSQSVKDAPLADFFKQKAREARMDHVEPLAQYLVENKIEASDIPRLKAADLRAVADAVGVDLPESLAKTQTVLKQRVGELQAARTATSTAKQSVLIAPVTSGDAPVQGQPSPSAIQVQTIPFAKEAPSPEVFKAKARATRADNVEVLADKLNAAGIHSDDVMLLPADKLRDLAKAQGIDLPKALTKTQTALRDRLKQLQTPTATTFQPSSELADKLMNNPKALAAAQALAEAMAGTR